LDGPNHTTINDNDTTVGNLVEVRTDLTALHNLIAITVQEMV